MGSSDAQSCQKSQPGPPEAPSVGRARERKQSPWGFAGSPGKAQPRVPPSPSQSAQQRQGPVSEHPRPSPRGLGAGQQPPGQPCGRLCGAGCRFQALPRLESPPSLVHCKTRKGQWPQSAAETPDPRAGARPSLKTAPVDTRHGPGGTAVPRAADAWARCRARSGLWSRSRRRVNRGPGGLAPGRSALSRHMLTRLSHDASPELLKHADPVCSSDI